MYIVYVNTQSYAYVFATHLTHLIWYFFGHSGHPEGCQFQAGAEAQHQRVQPDGQD